MHAYSVDKTLTMPAPGKLVLPIDIIPSVLRPHLPGHSDSGRRDHEKDELPGGMLISENEYYIALESYLSTVHPKSGDTVANISVTSENLAVEKDTSELEDFHIRHMLCGGWLFDHEAHARYSYYPSNLYPLGSTEEYTFFMRAWNKIVNRPCVDRLYNRGGDFKVILREVPAHVCPCMFLMTFNIQDRDVWSLPPPSMCGSADPTTTTTPKLPRLVVENELMFKSEFFNKKKAGKYFRYTNSWIYKTFIRDEKWPTKDQSRVKIGDKFQNVNVTNNWFRHKALEWRVVNRTHQGNAVLKNSEDKRQIQTNHTGDDNASHDTVSTAQDTNHRCGSPTNCTTDAHRHERMRGILGALFLGQQHQDNVVATSRHVHDRLLVRCEDYSSFLYSPSLKLTSCKHSDEEVTFVQTRSGDEIATEFRRCRACGRVRAM